MSQAGFTPIQLYHSTTAAAAPTAGNLANGELSINITDGKLFYKDNLGVVQVLATKAGASGDVVGPASSTDNALVRFDSTTGKLVQNSVGVLSDTGDLTGIAAVTMSGALTLSGGTANGVAYLNGSKVLTTGSALTFDGTRLTVNSGATSEALRLNATADTYLSFQRSGTGTAYIQSSTGGMLLWNQENTAIQFGVNNSEQMRLTSTGLGIGTSSPAAALHVASGNMRLTNGASFGTSNALIREINAAAGASNQFVTSAIGFRTGAFTDSGIITFSTALSASTPTERMRLDSSGNLGLGVTPSAWNSGYKAFEISNWASLAGEFAVQGGMNLSVNAFANSTGYNNWTYRNTAAATRYKQNDGIHSWFTAPSGTAGNAITFTQAMTLDASGNFGVGTTSIASGGAGTVNVNFHTPTSTSVYLKLSNAGTGNTTADGFDLIMGTSSDAYLVNRENGPMIFFTNATERARIDSSGNLLVGTAIAGGTGTTIGMASANGPLNICDQNFGNGWTTWSFRYAGTQVGQIVTNTTTVAYNTSSDYRLKNITGPITNSGAYIDSLNPVEGTWKSDGSAFVGLIAHEVQEASRTLVATGVKDGEQMQGMDYSSAEIIANMLAELKSLRARVAALEGQP